jgi:dinuclear metal center YbgI/SA1388 family protein
MLVKDVLSIIDRIAPFDTAEDYDNVGLLAGSPAQKVTGIMLALDATRPVIAEMKTRRLNLLVTHHPIFFTPVRRVLNTDYEGLLLTDMIRAGISMIAAHTNLDKAAAGTNAALCALLRLKNITGEAYVWIGEPEAGCVPASSLQAFIANRLCAPVVLMGDPDVRVFKLAVCSGGGSDEWKTALERGADAFLTGEVKHHHALEAAEHGFPLLAAGHFATEDPGMDALAVSLQKELVHVKCRLAVCRTEHVSYGVR